MICAQKEDLNRLRKMKKTKPSSYNDNGVAITCFTVF